MNDLPKTTVFATDDNVCICPSCGDLAEWQIDDYVGMLSPEYERKYYHFLCGPDSLKPEEYDTPIELGMVWCCQCRARCVIDPFVKPRKLTQAEVKEKWSNKIEEFRSKYGRYDYPRISDDIYEVDAFEVTLAFIERYVDSAVSCLTSERPLSREEISTIVRPREYSYYERQKEEEMSAQIQQNREKLGVKEQEESEDYPKLFNLSLETNSFDAFRPAVPYPNGIDLEHDGVMCYMKCRSATDQIFYYQMSGD